MEILLLLIPVSVVLLSIAAIGFNWAINHRQFDDLDRAALQIFEDVNDTVTPSSGEANHEHHN